MTTILWCLNCDWQGCSDELVALTYALDDRDFSYCPRCGGNEFEEEEEE